MTKLTNAEKDKLDNTCGNLRVTKLGTHVKSLEDFVNEGALATRANDVTSAINELYGMIANNECADIQIPPPGFFTLFGNDEDGKLYVYYNDEDHPPVFRHVEEPGELEGTLYLYIADPEGENHFEMEIGHYIAVRHLDNYYTKAEIDAGYAIKDHAVNANTYGLGSTSKYGHVKTINGLTQASHADGLALSAYQGKVLKTEIDKKVVTVQQLATATQGFTASYVIKQNGVQVGDTINIPKDFLVKSAELKTVTTVNQPVQGFKVGDKYIDWVINTIDSSENPQHLYLNVTDLIDVYTADEVTITLENNQFKIKNGGVGSTQLAKDSVITDKIKDSNVTTAKIKDGNVTTVKIKDANVTTDKIADSNVTTDKIANGAVTNDKVASITKNKISDFSHTHGNLQNDGKVGTTNNANKNVVTDGDGKITTEPKPVVADAVEEGNTNAVSSNAVYDYVGDVSKEIPVKNYQQFISLIARAEDGDVIVLDADYNFSKTPLTYYPVSISKSLTIFGNGHRIYTENDEKNTYFTVRSGVNHKTTLAFYDTVFTNLKCDESLFATDNQYYPYSELIFDNCMFINNSAKVICDGSLGDYSTGPGDEDKEAKITIRKCTFKNNKTTYGTLFFKYGSSVTDSVFTANTASTTGYGGAIHRVSGNVSVVDCEFNTTTDTVVGVTPIDSIQQKINTSIAGKIDTAGAGLTKEGTSLKHSNNVTAQTSSALKKIKYDAQGHITGTDAVAKSDITGLGIPAQDTVYTHPNSGANADTTGKFNKLKYNAQGHVTGAVAVAKSDITALGIPGQDTTYTPASENPLMDGSVDKGSSEKYAREDHRHPTDTSRASTAVVTANANGLMSSTDKSRFDKSMAVGQANAAGTTSAYTATITGVTLTHGTLIILYNAVGANAANATLNVNGLGAKPIYYNASAIPASRFPNKATCLLMYNTSIVSTGCWQLIYSYDSNNTYTAASATPTADTASGAVGTATKYAREDHVHPKSSIYAESSHTHTKSQIADFPTSMTPSSHSHGSLANGGTLNSDISSVNKIAVTDSSNNLKTISKLPADKVTHQDISGKVDKVTGKGLSTEDFTTAEKTKLAGIATSANATEYIVGTHGTTATNVWTGTSTKISSLAAGQVIYFKMTSAGTSSAATLNLTLANGTTTGAKNIRYNAVTNLTTHFPINSVLCLVYDGNYWICTEIQNTNNIDRVQQSPRIVAGEALSGGQLAWGKADGKYYKIASGLVFDIRHQIAYLGGNVNSGANSNNTYSFYAYANLQNTLANKTITSFKKVYVKGTLSKNSFTVHSDVFVSDDNLTDGFYYIPIGTSYSTKEIAFNNTDQTVYKYTTANGLLPVGYSYNDLLDKPTYTAATLKDPNAHTEAINTAANATQTSINSALDSAIETINYTLDTMDVVPVLVTYTDNTTETLKLCIWTL